MAPLGRNLLGAKNIESQSLDVKIIGHLKNGTRQPTSVGLERHPNGMPDHFLVGVFSKFISHLF